MYRAAVIAAFLLLSGAGNLLAATAPVFDGLTVTGPIAAPNVPIPPTLYGAKGDGTTDDTTAVQAAINAAATAGVCVQFDASHLYNITSPLTMSQPGCLEGPFRYGIWHVNQPSGTGVEKCPWGLVTKNTGINLINATAITGTIRGVCMDMTGNNTTQATSGAAINLAPPGTATYQSGWQIELNTIVQAWLAIGINGAGYSAACCGAGTAADGIALLHNTIVNPAYAAIEIGKNTAYAATVGLTVTDNAIVCGKGGLPRGKGIIIHDGGMYYNGTQNGPEGCAVGIEVTPSDLGGNPQWAQYDIEGTVGDQSTVHDLWVHPGNNGYISLGRIHGAWMNQTSNGTSVLIDCTAPSNTFCDGITIVDSVIFGGSEQNQPIVDIRAGAAGPFNFQFSNNQIRQGGTGAVNGGNAVALNIHAAAGTNYAGNWNITNNLINAISLGCCASGHGADPIGLKFDDAGMTSLSSGAVNITGNNFSNHLNSPSTPISYAPGSAGDTGNRVIIANNIGIDDAGSQPITAAASITLVNAYPSYLVTGTTTIATISGIWANRKISLAAAATGTLNLGIGGNICAPAITGGNTVLLQYPLGSTCWQHVP